MVRPLKEREKVEANVKTYKTFTGSNMQLMPNSTNAQVQPNRPYYHFKSRGPAGVAQKPADGENQNA